MLILNRDVFANYTCNSDFNTTVLNSKHMYNQKNFLTKTFNQPDLTEDQIKRKSKARHLSNDIMTEHHLPGSSRVKTLSGSNCYYPPNISRK